MDSRRSDDGLVAVTKGRDANRSVGPALGGDEGRVRTGPPAHLAALGHIALDLTRTGQGFIRPEREAAARNDAILEAVVPP